jgi:alpha-ketoglutarate-dependent taurine dioxygenase
MTALEFHALDAPFGAEVLGFDPDAPVDDETRRALQAALDERGLLVFRDRPIPHRVQVELCEMLTTDARAAVSAWAGAVADDYYVSNRRDDGATPFGRLPFHSDGMWSRQPHLALSLYAVEIEAPAVPTTFASTAYAWATLPDALRERVDGLHAVHILGVIPRGEHFDEIVVADFGLDVSTMTPIAHTHPRTGAMLLYVSQQMTREIVELSVDESEALLAELFAHLYAEADLLHHEWRAHDLVLWDNIAVQHARPDVRTDGPVRTLRKYGTPDLDLSAVQAPTYTRRG